jgi:hypothetical protein
MALLGQQTGSLLRKAAYTSSLKPHTASKATTTRSRTRARAHTHTHTHTHTHIRCVALLGAMPDAFAELNVVFTHTLTYNIRASALMLTRMLTSAYVSMHQHTSAYVSVFGQARRSFFFFPFFFFPFPPAYTEVTHVSSHYLILPNPS